MGNSHLKLRLALDREGRLRCEGTLVSKTRVIRVGLIENFALSTTLAFDSG